MPYSGYANGICSRCADPQEKHLDPECRYQGWENHTTWSIHLWLSNEQGDYEKCRKTGQRIKAEAVRDENVLGNIWTVEQAARFRFADWLRGYTEEMLMSQLRHEQATLASDLLTSALGDCNWQEIADAFLED